MKRTTLKPPQHQPLWLMDGDIFPSSTSVAPAISLGHMPPEGPTPTTLRAVALSVTTVRAAPAAVPVHAANAAGRVFCSP